MSFDPSFVHRHIPAQECPRLVYPKRARQPLEECTKQAFANRKSHTLSVKEKEGRSFKKLHTPSFIFPGEARFLEEMLRTDQRKAAQDFKA